MHLAFCFTFQSGYIQIILFMKSLAVLQALHSNLVIFKWLSKIVRWILYVLYIPIWLYSNDIDKLADNILHFFTFQSGYIQIISYLAPFIPDFHLYIPIWLYSNEAAYSDIESLRRLYIPIWLYSNLTVRKALQAL